MYKNWHVNYSTDFHCDYLHLPVQIVNDLAPPLHDKDENVKMNFALMVNIMLFMLVRGQSLMVFPPLRPFSLVITVHKSLFGTPNTCSQS